MCAKIQTNHPIPNCDWQKWKLADCLFVHQPHDYHSLLAPTCIRIWSHKEIVVVLANSRQKIDHMGLNPGLSSHHPSIIPRRIRLMFRFYGTLTPTWELRANGLIRHMSTQIRIRKSRVTMRRNPFDFLFEGVQRFKLVDSMEQLWVNFTCTWPSKMATSLTSFRDFLPKGLLYWVTPDVVQFGSHHHGLPGLSSDQTWLVSTGMHGISQTKSFDAPLKMTSNVSCRFKGFQCSCKTNDSLPQVVLETSGKWINIMCIYIYL